MALHDSLGETTRDVLKGDFTQYMQNAFTVASLLFTLFLGSTLEVLFQRQAQLYRALYDEVAETKALIEQIALISAARGSMWDEFLEEEGGPFTDLLAYIELDLRQVGRPRLLPSSACGDVDPLEKLLFSTSVGEPSVVCDSVRAIRQARAMRLAAVQRRFPLGHFIIAGAYGLFMLIFFFITGAGIAGFEATSAAATEPGGAVALLAPLFGLLVTAVVLIVMVLRELSDPGGGIFGVQLVLDEALDRLVSELQARRRWVHHAAEGR